MNQADVHYISTYTVRPSTPSLVESQQRWELTPWDLGLLSLNYLQKGLLFLKPQSEDHSVVDLLKASLSDTLDHFLPLAGRLAITVHDDNDPPSTSFFISYNGEGAQFIHATANLTVADIIDPLYVPPIVHSFFPLNGANNYDGHSQPLLSVQVTELVDGIFIGCSINHVVVDGTPFWHFFNSWSEISRGIQPISRPPILEHWFSEGSVVPIRLSLPQDKFMDRYTPPLLSERIFHFSSKSIAHLKEKANVERGTDKISSLQALLAHVWRSITRARNLPTDQETTFHLAIGNRQRLNPPLPENYFGNSVQGKGTTTTTSELLEQGLGWAAWLLNQVVASHTDFEVRSHLESWVKNPFTANFSRHKPGNLMTGSSPRFEVYGNDFGWGRPVSVRSGASNKADGTTILFPGPFKGSIEVEVSLAPQTMKALGDDQEFMEAVTLPALPIKTFS